jgi:hypothetical protein
VDNTFPLLRQVVLDTTDARGLAEFYRQLLGYVYHAGDEPPTDGRADEKADDWLVIHDPAGASRIAFQAVESLPRTTWPSTEVPQQLHLDLSVRTRSELDASHANAIQLGATLLIDDADNAEEPIRVYADPSGHPFCIFKLPE